jgi:hypothetical protein
MPTKDNLGACHRAEVGGEQVCCKLLDTTDGRTRPAQAEPLAVIGFYKLLVWESAQVGTGRIGIATVLLPSRKLGGFAIYDLAFAEWWTTSGLRRVSRRDHRELNTALPFAVALVRQIDPDALRLRDPFSPRSRVPGGAK